MGIGTIGTAIGKEIIAWTRTGGKSLLATIPVKVNTAGLRLAPKLEGDIVQISNHKAGTILNTKTGIHENVTFSDLPSKVDNGKHYILTAYNIYFSFSFSGNLPSTNFTDKFSKELFVKAFTNA